MNEETTIERKEQSQSLLQRDDTIEIDIVEKAKELWGSRRVIMIFVAVFLGIGYFHTEYGPTEFTSVTSLIQESEGSEVGDFGSSFLTSITGFNFPRGGSNNMSAVATGRAPLPVTLYPRIINSSEFQKELIYTEFDFARLDTSMTLIEYHSEFLEAPLRDKVYNLVSNYTIYLPFTILNWTRSMWRSVTGFFQSIGGESAEGSGTPSAEDETEVMSDDRLLSITPQERSVMDWLALRITMLSAGGVMDISTRLPDPLAAAQVNARLIEYIQEYITDYRVEKARQNLEATLERYELAKERYEEAQYELAKFRDENVALSTETAQIREQRLSNEANLRGQIYNQVAQEVEQARMVLQQQIPVFNTLEKPNVPNAPSSGSSPLLLILAGLVGLFMGVGYVLVSGFVKP